MRIGIKHAANRRIRKPHIVGDFGRFIHYVSKIEARTIVFIGITILPNSQTNGGVLAMLIQIGIRIAREIKEIALLAVFAGRTIFFCKCLHYVSFSSAGIIHLCIGILTFTLHSRGIVINTQHFICASRSIIEHIIVARLHNAPIACICRGGCRISEQ